MLKKDWPIQWNGHPPACTQSEKLIKREPGLETQYFSSHMPLKAANFSIILKRIVCLQTIYSKVDSEEGQKDTQKNISFHFHWAALGRLPASSEKGTFWHLSVGSNILKCRKGETKNFPCAAFLSDLLSHMFPSGMHEKFLWIIHKHLGFYISTSFYFWTKRLGKKLIAAVLLCSIWKKTGVKKESNSSNIASTEYIHVCIYEVYKQTYAFMLGKAPLYLKLHIPLRARLILYLSKIQEIT